MASADDAKPCQVCGAPLEGNLLFCARCDTPHHADCWRWNGGCSTYGCGSQACRSAAQGQVPAPVLEIVADAPEPDDPLQIDGPAPTEPGLLDTDVGPHLERAATLTVMGVRNLAVLAVKLTAAVAYLLVVPGSLLWCGCFGLAEGRAGPGKRDRPPRPGGILTTDVGPTTYGPLTALAVVGAILAVTAALVASNPAFAWVLRPLALYLILSPLFTPLMEHLARLPLPGFAPPALPEDAGQRRLRRRLPPTEPGDQAAHPGRRSRRKKSRRRRRRS